jgi:hypothetical protein
VTQHTASQSLSRSNSEGKWARTTMKPARTLELVAGAGRVRCMPRSLQETQHAVTDDMYKERRRIAHIAQRGANPLGIMPDLRSPAEVPPADFSHVYVHCF